MRFSAFVLILCLFVTNVAAENSRPLLMPGKQSLYQRMLNKPGALIFQSPGADIGEPTKPFTAYYIYQRREQAGQQWLQVGINRHGDLRGWIREHELIPWNQGLTVAFREPLGHDRVLLFRDNNELKQLIEADDPAVYRELYSAAESGQLPADSPVIAIQPSNHVDILQDFYLVPIRSHEDIYLGSEPARLLQVSSVPLESRKQAQPKPQQPATPAAPLRRFRSGVVFVIDSTLSMDPYIDRTRKAVRKIYDVITREELTGDVSFGLVAFRDSTDAVPELEYRSRVYVDLEQGKDAAGFFGAVESLKAATASSKGFKM